MADIVIMPKLGFDMAEGTLVRWVVGEGQEVSKGAVLAEIETDKATVEVESNFEGVLVQQLVKEGTPVPVGEPIAVVGKQGEKVDVGKLVGEIAPEAETGLKPAAPVEEQEALPRDSKLEETKAQAPEEQKPAEQKPSAQPQPEVVAPEEPVETGGDGQLPGGVRASPIARRMAEEKGIDLRAVKGTGPQGRVTKQDIESYVPGPAGTSAAAPEEKPEARPAAAPAKQAAAPVTAFGPVGAPREDQRVPVSRLRAAIGRRMVEAKQQVPHFYVTYEYDMGPVMALRKQINAMLSAEEKLSVNDFLVKAVALTLRQFPNLNASIQGNEVIRHGQINIGNAVAVEGGLLTVVCRDADRKSLGQISMEVRTMASRAREGKVKPEDIEGSTFSISNLGMFNVEHFIAIINPPEAAILAVGAAQEVPVVKDGQIVPGMRMKATISIDHRISDGAEAARFMQALAPYLEEPMRLLL